MIPATDIIMLALMLVGYFPIIISSARREFTRWFYFAYTSLFIGVVARVMGYYFRPEMMMIVERGVGIAFAGIFALIGSYIHFRKIQTLQWNEQQSAPLQHKTLAAAVEGKKGKKNG